MLDDRQQINWLNYLIGRYEIELRFRSADETFLDEFKLAAWQSWRRQNMPCGGPEQTELYLGNPRDGRVWGE